MPARLFAACLAIAGLLGASSPAFPVESRPVEATGTSLSDLPLVARPPLAGSETLIVLLSGDGGWDDLEDGLAASLNAGGPGVVGLDAKTYFFERKTAGQVAADIERIVSVYRRAWHTRHLVLAGYSFGGNILPFAWPELSARTRRATRLLALVSPTPTANFQISLLEMLDLPSSDDTPLGPALRHVPMDRLICIYGEDEGDKDASGCELPEIPPASRIERPGSHRFDGSTDLIATAILRRLR